MDVMSGNINVLDVKEVKNEGVFNMEKKYQIFISSTYTDLVEERKKVSDTILAMYQFSIGMEMFSAADEDQWEIIQDTIDSSDYYVLIVGHRYGSVIKEGTETGVSYTEKEYQYAKSKGIPILAFIISDSVPILPQNIEDDFGKKERLDLFIKEIAIGRTVEWWQSKDDLANKVMNALNKQFIRKKRPGWVRADGFSIEETQKELIEQSKKIRSLEKENAELQEQVVVRVPELKVEINENNNLMIPFYEEMITYIDAEYKPLSLEDVPEELKVVVTKKQLDTYNAHLPSKEEINEYKNKLQFYNRAQEHAFDIDLKVLNDGKLKARDVRVEIEFPDEIKFFKKKSIKDMEKPKPLNKEISPIEKQLIKSNSLSKVHATARSLPQVFTTKLIDLDDINQMDYANKHFYNDDNSISIVLEDLLNSYTWSVKDKYCVVPEKRGNFEVKCSMICEEFSEVKTQIIQFMVG